MISRMIKDWTNKFIREDCFDLYVRVEYDSEYGHVFCSAWEPTPKQLEILNAGGSIVVKIVGTGQPPLMLDAEPQ